MQLYLLRHGPAAARDSALYPDDTQRPLTSQGRAKTRAAARGMKAAGLRFDLVLTSPLVRAKQTAHIVAETLPDCPRPRILHPLAPGGSNAEILARIPKSRPSTRVLLVGHEPGLTQLAADLLLPGSLQLAITLRKGGLICIDFDGPPAPAAGRLILLLTPKILRGL